VPRERKKDVNQNYQWPKPKGKKFKPTAHSYGPHAQAAHDAGGHLSAHDLHRAKFNAELKAYAPGCGSPVRVAGTSGGHARCGSKVGDEKVYCAHCGPTLEAAVKVVNRMLEADVDDPASVLQQHVTAITPWYVVMTAAGTDQKFYLGVSHDWIHSADNQPPRWVWKMTQPEAAKTVEQKRAQELEIYGDHPLHMYSVEPAVEGALGYRRPTGV
jgi:hypothetical protein